LPAPKELYDNGFMAGQFRYDFSVTDGKDLIYHSELFTSVQEIEFDNWSRKCMEILFI
jgi:hypothetical protein